MTTSAFVGDSNSLISCHCYSSNNNENQNSSSSVDSSGYNSCQSRKGNYKVNREKNVKSGLLEMKSFINVDDGSNLTDLSPVLTCIRTLSDSDVIWNESRSKYFKSVSLKQLKNDINVPKEDGFCFAVSLRDGLCLFTSSAITDHLGYPRDMLNGQCFMNFVFQKDHITFANHLTQGLNACFIQGKRDETHLVVNSFFCRLRVYQSLKFGYSVADKKIEYKPFKITLHVNELIVDDICVEKSPATLCVRATATGVSSAYTIPEEIPAMTSFSTRHTASCHFSHVDFSAIPYLGYLPQDMIGISLFNFYHIDDMPQLKDIYELVVKEHGSSFRSKPYRFKVQNGCYVMLETEWSCFINPWSHKLEFVVGQHRVLKGPHDVNIFNEIEVEENTASDEIIKESQKIQKEIKVLLSQTMKNVGGNKSKRYCNKRKRDLASFVYNCIDEGYVGNKKGNSDKQDMVDDRSNSDPDSVVMGDISPYRDINDSSVSSETPPTVQQLRYQENIERFFASQPKTYSDGSDDSNKNEKSSSGEDYQGSTSGSGNGSGNTSKDTSTSKKYETKMQQESSSNSSKCNMSSFTTGDSGYGKSLKKDNHNYPSNSLTGSSSQTWKKSSNDCINNNNENFSSCLALTEEILSAHNRINHKHLKQHQRKNKSSMGHTNTIMKDNNWFQTKDIGHGKHKKYSHNHNLTASTPTQTDMNFTPSHNMSLHFPQPSHPTSVHPNNVSTHMPQVSYSCLIPPNNFTSAAPTPFFIPVVYMGSVPYYPPLSNVQPQNTSPFWSYPASAPTGEVPTPSFPFPIIPPCSPHTNVAPPSGMGYPTFPFTNFNPFSGIPFGVQSSGVTATSLSTTTTTTVASGSLHNAFKSTITNSLDTFDQKRIQNLKLKDINSRIPNNKTEVNECDMLVDDTRSSSFTQSSSMHSAEKDEDMDFEIKKCHPGPPRSDKVELSSEIAYRYQMKVPNIDDILKKDLEILKSMQQPELVNKQLQILQSELQSETENQAQADNDFCMIEPVMLGLVAEADVNEELEYREEYLLHLMCEDS